MKLGIFLICLGIFVVIKGTPFYTDWFFTMGYIFVALIPIGFGIKCIMDWRKNKRRNKEGGKHED